MTKIYFTKDEKTKNAVRESVIIQVHTFGTFADGANAVADATKRADTAAVNFIVMYYL